MVVVLLMMMLVRPASGTCVVTAEKIIAFTTPTAAAVAVCVMITTTTVSGIATITIYIAGRFTVEAQDCTGPGRSRPQRSVSVRVMRFVSCSRQFQTAPTASFPGTGTATPQQQIHGGSRILRARTVGTVEAVHRELLFLLMDTVCRRGRGRR